MSRVGFFNTDRRVEMNCRWCGEAATVEREIEPAILEPKTKVVKKRAVTAWVCPTHSAMVDRNLECRETEKAIHRIDLMLRKMPPTDPKHDGLVRRREELRDLLHQIQGRAAA
jgi:hypothetical protein